MPLSVLSHNSFDAPGLREAWERLSSISPTGGLFSTYSWCRAWWEHLGQNTEPVILQIVDDNGATVGLAPFCRNGSPLPRWLRFMGRERASGDHLDILWQPEVISEGTNTLLVFLDKTCDEVDGLLLGELHTDSNLRGAMVDWAQHHRFVCHEREHRQLPFIQLPSDFEEYLGALSSKMRFQVRRCGRRILGRSDTECRVIREAVPAQEVLTQFFELHRRRWALDNLAGNFSDESMQSFLRDFCQAAGERGWLRLYALETSGVALGVLIAFHWKDTAYYYQMGWDPDEAKESPGVLLIATSIQQAIAEGLIRYDFLCGDESYKSRWTSQAVEAGTLVIGISTAARRAIRTEKLKNVVKKSLSYCFGPRIWERTRQLFAGAHA